MKIKSLSSNELRAQRDEVAISMRNLNAEIDQKQASRRGTQAGTPAFEALTDEIEELQAKARELKNQKRERDLALYRALVAESKELSALNEKMVAELTPKIEAILSELELETEEAIKRLEALTKGYFEELENVGI